MPKGKRGKPPEEKRDLKKQVTAIPKIKIGKPIRNKLTLIAPVVAVEPPAPENVPAAVIVDQTPIFVGPHAEFLVDETPLICLEGSRYSGKTWVTLAKVVKSCLANPGIEWLISRYANEETEKKLIPEFRKMCHRYGQFPDWVAKENAFHLPNGSRVEATGLRSPDKLGHLAKVRGLDKGGILNDQSEELPQDVGEELPFGARQSGYPHQVIYTPNPPPEDHWLSDFFPDDNSVPGRKLYRVALRDNPYCPEDKLAELERLYPPTHPRYKTLVLGLRGPAAVGTPIYESAFIDDLHLAPVLYDPDQLLLEAIHAGQHHPVWLVAQRNYFGGIEILGGVMGKRLFLEDFVPIVERYRQEWFGIEPNQVRAKTRLCCDPPAQGASLKFTNIKILSDAGLAPKYKIGGNSPDVREAVIQSIVGHMHRRLGKNQAFRVNNDKARWLMASHVIVKQSKFFVDGLQANYVWDEHPVSVANKLHRQPQANEWVEGAQRCLENLVLNFWANRKTPLEITEADAKRRDTLAAQMGRYIPVSPWS